MERFRAGFPELQDVTASLGTNPFPASFEVRPEVQDAYNEEMQSRLARSVWDAGGCGSWYLDANGRDSTMRPGYTFEFEMLLRNLAGDCDCHALVTVVSARALPATDV